MIDDSLDIIKPLTKAESSFRLLRNAIHAKAKINTSLSRPKLTMSPYVGALRETKQRVTTDGFILSPSTGTKRSPRGSLMEPKPPVGYRVRRRTESNFSESDGELVFPRRSLFNEDIRRPSQQRRSGSRTSQASTDTSVILDSEPMRVFPRTRRSLATSLGTSSRRATVVSPTGSRRETRKSSVLHGDINSCLTTKANILKAHSDFVNEIKKHEVVGTSLLRIYKAALHVFKCDELSPASLSTFLHDTKLEPSTATSRLIEILCSPSLCFRSFVILLLSFSDDLNRSAFARTPIAVLSKLIDDNLLRYYSDVLSDPSGAKENFDPDWLQNTDLDDYMYMRNGILKKFFQCFVTKDAVELGWQSQHTIEGIDSHGSHWRGVMGSESFASFAKYICIYPQIVTSVVLQKVIRASSLLYPSHPSKQKSDKTLIIEPEFHDAIVRLAASLFGNELFHCMLPSSAPLVDKVDTLFTVFLSDAYARLTGHPLESDINDLILRKPCIRLVAPVTGSAGEHIRFEGSNFCSLRGVSIKFGEQTVRAHTISSDYVLCKVPHSNIQCNDFTVCVFTNEAHIRIVRRCFLQVANNRIWISPPQQYQRFTVIQSHTVLSIPECVINYSDELYNHFRRDLDFLTYSDWRLACSCLRLDQYASFSLFRECSTYTQVSNVGYVEAQRSSDFLGSLILLTLYKENTSKEDLDRVIPGELLHILEQCSLIRTNDVQIPSNSFGFPTDLFANNTRQYVVQEISFLAAANLIETSYDILVGPRLIGVLSYCGMFESALDDEEQCSQINKITLPTECIDEALRRLRDSGYISAPHCYDSAKGKHFISRCWSLSLRCSVVGHLWERPGVLSCSDWCPLPTSLSHPTVSIHLPGLEKSSSDFLQLFILFREQCELSKFRQALGMLGYVITTVLP